MILAQARTEAEIEAAETLWTACEREGGPHPFPGGERISWFVREGDQIVGVVAAHGFDWISRRCGGAVYILPEYRNKGLASRAMSQRNALLFDQFNLRRIEAAILLKNLASIRMAEKTGARREGELRDALYWGGQYHTTTLWVWTRKEG